MKKLMVMGGAVLAAMLLAGCNQSSQNNSASGSGMSHATNMPSGAATNSMSGSKTNSDTKK